MQKKTFLSVGECMLELSGAAGGKAGLWQMGYAGDTLNTAWYARAALDPQAWDVAYFTRLGRDGFSQRMVDFIASNGIGTQWIGRDENRIAGLYAIELNEGERSFTYWRDRSAARLLADDEAVLKAAFDAADAIYLSGITLAILTPDRRTFLTGLLSQATGAGKLTAFDPNIRPRLWPDMETARTAIMATAAAVQLVLPSFDDEKTAFGDTSPEATLARYRAAGVQEVVVKNGRDPALISWPKGLDAVPAGAIASVVDTTGAGDSFNGGYLAARLSGNDPLTAARAGHRIAGKVVGHPGALMAMELLREAI